MVDISLFFFFFFEKLIAVSK